MNNRFFSGILAGLLLLNLSNNSFAAYANIYPKNLYTDIQTDIIVDESVFSDESFRNWILDKNNLNGIGEDGKLTYEERLMIKSINISDKKISDLQGIEVFPNLETLDCSRNSLTSIDLSENTMLKSLNCSYNQLTDLSLNNQTELNSLNCNYNKLTYLDISNKPKLRALSCEYNYIEQLNISNNINLEWINIRTNLLTNLDTTDNINLKVIEAFDNKLETIKLTTLSNLDFLNVASNQLKELDLSQNSNLSIAGGGFAAYDNLLEKIILPNQPQLKIDINSISEQNPITGYDRVKWFSDEDLMLELPEEVSAEGQTIYSKRIANDYKVYFSSNGGNGAMQPQEAIYGQEFSLNECTFTRTGYVFNGWNTMPKGNGTSYENSKNVLNLAGKNNDSRITLYAQWEPIEYTVKFDANSEDAQGSMEDQTAVYNTDLTLTDCGFTVDGKEFAGWSQQPDSQVRYRQGASVRNLASSQGETATLYAVWKTPVEELQKPYLTKLDQSFNNYSNSDYTSEDWDLIANAYHKALLLISEESDTDTMEIYCNDAAEEMSAVMTKDNRVQEISQGWNSAHNDVLQNINTAILNEDNNQLELAKSEAAINEMSAKELQKYSSLSNSEDLERTSYDALEEIAIHFEDLSAYATASKWINNVNDDAKRPLNEVKTDSFELYQSLNSQYNLLSEKEKLQIDSELTTRFEERLNLVTQKFSAVSELKGVFYSIDQSEYTEFSRESLAKELKNGIERIENSESESAIVLNIAQSTQDILNVSPNEEEPSSPDEDPSDDENNDNNGSGGGNNGGNNGGSSGGSNGGSSGGSSGGIILPVYSINIGNFENGTVVTNVNKALKGSVVIINATPYDGYRIKTIEVIDSKNNFIDLKTEEYGKYTFIMPDSSVTVKINFAKEFNHNFKDVEDDSWYYNAVCYVNENGLFKGMSEDNFGVNENMVRSMLMTVLYRAAGEPDIDEDHGFIDVEENTWYTVPIKWAKHNGIALGEDNNTFAPHKSITREQLAAMLYRYSGQPDNTGDLQQFKDSDQIEEFAVDAFKWAVGNKIILGMGDDTLNPKGEATRAQVAQVIMNLLENENK